MIDPGAIVMTSGSVATTFVNAAFATGGMYIMSIAPVPVLPISYAVPLQSAIADVNGPCCAEVPVPEHP